MHEELEKMARDAEDEGKEVYVQRHEPTGIIEYVEVNGKEYPNEDYVDEVKDVYWTEDAYRVAERMMY